MREGANSPASCFLKRRLCLARIVKGDQISDNLLKATGIRQRGCTREQDILATNRLLGESKAAIAPLQFGPDGKLYVSSRAGKDKLALYRFDLDAGRLGASPVLETTGYDFAGRLVATCSKVLGVEFVTDARYP